MGLGIKTKILGTNIGNWVHCYYSMKRMGIKGREKVSRFILLSDSMIRKSQGGLFGKEWFYIIASMQRIME